MSLCLFCPYSFQELHFFLTRDSTITLIETCVLPDTFPTHTHNLLHTHTEREHPNRVWQAIPAKSAWLVAIFMSHNTATPDGRQRKLFPPELFPIQFYQSTSSWEWRTIQCFSQLTHANNSAHYGLPMLIPSGKGEEKKALFAHDFPRRCYKYQANLRMMSVGVWMWICSGESNHGGFHHAFVVSLDL